MDKGPQKLTAFGMPQAVLPGFGVGKWSRIATFGTKRQRQPDDTIHVFEFSKKTFAQALVNFRRMFAQRRMGSDWEHQALHAPLNGRPAPNLCFWDAFGVIEGDRVTGVQEQAPGPQPDPAALRALLAERFPTRTRPHPGLWVRCAEITPLGRSSSLAMSSSPRFSVGTSWTRPASRSASPSAISAS
jgi:hypothetical protein